MKKSGTLPSIKQKQLIINPGKAKETYRRLQNKINSHDQEIIRNEKVISNLANQFRLLKEQLQFEQQYSEKYKTAIQKYEEQGIKFNKVIKEQKTTIVKLELMLKEKDKIIQIKNKEVKNCKDKDEEHLKTIESMEQNIKNLKKKQQQIKVLENQREALKKQLKQKSKQLKDKSTAIRRQSQSSKISTDERIKNLQQQIESLRLIAENGKQNLVQKERQLEKMTANVLTLQQKVKTLAKNESKLNNYGEEMKNLSQMNEKIKKELSQKQKIIEGLLFAAKSTQTKFTASLNEKTKQFNLQKKELNDKLGQLQSKFDELSRKRQNELEEKQNKSKAEAQIKSQMQDIQSKLSKITKSKEDIAKQLSKLKANIMCDFCGKAMKNPVTNIPCGHSYCQQCKKGYQKECKKCPGAKREAVYRNELLDEIIQASNLVQKIVTLLPN